ncbi:MAG: hypothetical protein V4623_00015 [Pseudomonadota bacterium]
MFRTTTTIARGVPPSISAASHINHLGAKVSIVIHHDGLTLNAMRQQFPPNKSFNVSGHNSMIIPPFLPVSPPLRNVYGGAACPVTLIPREELLYMSGAFKYCVTQNPRTQALGTLVTENVSGAHTGLLAIAEKMGLDVVMAGHIHLISGAKEGDVSEVKAITNTSGHLQPEGTPEQHALVERAFKATGLHNVQGTAGNQRWCPSLERYVPEAIALSIMNKARLMLT